MKTRSIFKGQFFILALAGSLLFASCKKDKDSNDNVSNYSVSGNASGSQENPPVTTSGTATLTGTYNSNTNKLDYTITWSSLSGAATAVSLYGPASSGSNADLIIGLTISTNGINGTSSGSVTLSDEAESNLLNGMVYYNIHTLSNPDGEVRGQITAVAD